MPPYTISDFFPDCLLPHCNQRGTSHTHILPKQQEILSSTSKYLYCQGGVGSGKSLPFAVKAVYLSCTIPNNKGVVSRLHYDDLFDSTWREVNDCLIRLVDRQIIPKPKYSKKVQGEYTQIDLFNGSEIKAVQGKNWQRALGASHGWFLVDDAQECQEQFFIGSNVSGGLLSRLRLPHILYNEQVYDAVKRPYGALHGMVCSNPPPYGHWLHRLFGDKPGTYTIGEDTITWIMMETDDNPFVGAHYSKGIISVQRRMGGNQATIDRVIFGKSTPAYKGIPVFPTFDRAKHIAPLKFRPDLPLIRAWDFGYAHPAVVFSNIFKCPHNTNHYFTLSEVADAKEVTVYTLYEDYVKPHTLSLYSKASLIRDCGDRAGYRASTSNKDRRSDMKILMAEYHLSFRWRYMNLEPSLQYMRSLLQPKTPCKCGLPLVLISNQCPVLIQALDGGYHYPKSRSGVTADKPYEDKLFADVACAWRYGAENYVKWGVSYSELQQSTSPASPQRRQSFQQPMLQWLNDTDADFVKRMQT